MRTWNTWLIFKHVKLALEIFSCVSELHTPCILTGCHSDGLVQDCGISGAITMEIPQSLHQAIDILICQKFHVNCLSHFIRLVCGDRTPMHFSDAKMSMMVSQITGGSIVCSTICSGTGQRKYQSSVSLAFVRGIHQSLVDSPHKEPVAPKIFPFDDGIMANHTKAWAERITISNAIRVSKFLYFDSEFTEICY